MVCGYWQHGQCVVQIRIAQVNATVVAISAHAQTIRASVPANVTMAVQAEAA